MATRTNIRQRALRTYGQGFVGSATSAGDTTSLLDTKLVRFPNNHWVGALIRITSGTISGDTLYCTSFLASTGDITFTPTAANAPGSGAAYELYKTGLDFDSWNDLIYETILRCQPLILLPYINESLTLDEDIFDYAIPYPLILSAQTASATGTTTTLIDASRTEAADYWIGSVLVATSGSALGDIRVVTDFSAALDTLTVTRPFTGATANNDTYNLYQFLPSTIHALQWYDSDGEWQEIPNAAWEIKRLGDSPVIHFYNYHDSPIRGRVWGIQDARPLRIIGTREPMLPDDENDPIEVPEALMHATLRYLYYEAIATSPAVDPKESFRKLAAARDDLERVEARFHRRTPPNSRLVV